MISGMRCLEHLRIARNHPEKMIPSANDKRTTQRAASLLPGRKSGRCLAGSPSFPSEALTGPVVAAPLILFSGRMTFHVDTDAEREIKASQWGSRGTPQHEWDQSFWN